MASTLFQVDLAAQANQTIVSGANTIAGKTWYAKGNLVQGGATYTRNLVNGLGLSIKHTAGFATTSVGTNGDLDYPHFTFPLSQLTGYSGARQLLIRARFNYDVVTDPNVLFGLVDTTNDAVGLRAASRSKEFLVGPTGGTGLLSVKRGTAALSNLTGRTGSFPNNEIIPGILRNTIPGWEFCGSERLASGMPSGLSSFLPVTPASSPDMFMQVSRTNECLCFAVASTIGTLFGAYLAAVQIIALDDLLDTTAPVVTPVTLVSRPVAKADPLVLLVTDDIQLKGLVVMVKYPNGDWEGAYDGTTFSSRYLQAASGTSTLEKTDTTHWTLTLRREGGWPFDPIVCVKGVDIAGNMS